MTSTKLDALELCDCSIIMMTNCTDEPKVWKIWWFERIECVVFAFQEEVLRIVISFAAFKWTPFSILMLEYLYFSLLVLFFVDFFFCVCTPSGTDNDDIKLQIHFLCLKRKQKRNQLVNARVCVRFELHTQSRIRIAITSIVLATIAIAPIRTVITRPLRTHSGVFGNSFHGHTFNQSKIDGVSVAAFLDMHSRVDVCADNVSLFLSLAECAFCCI